MIQPSLTEWPIHYIGQEPQPRGGVAPLRHDLALVQYLEKQAAHRSSSAHQGDGGAAAISRCARIAHSCFIALRALRAPLRERRRNWAG